MEENNNNKIVTGIESNVLYHGRCVSYHGRTESLDGCNTCVLKDCCKFEDCPCGRTSESFVDIRLKFDVKRLEGRQRNIIFDGSYVEGDSCSTCVLDDRCPFDCCPLGIHNGNCFIDINLKLDKSYLE